jgi:DNA-binding NarL/FixJ family response regulator
MIRVVLADDQRIVREGLALVIGTLDGVELLRAVADGAEADDATLLPALQAGAHGYLTKDASAEEIEAGIRAVHEGRTHLDPAVQARLVELATTAPPPAVETAPAATADNDDDLTPRELEVLRLIAAGRNNAEIADDLVLSAATVKTHINRIFAKTGARDRAQAIRYALDRGLA